MQKRACPPKHKVCLSQLKQYNQKLEEHRRLKESTSPCLDDEKLFIHETVCFVDTALGLFNFQQLRAP